MASAFQGHIRRIHQKQRHFPCRYCSKPFYTRFERDAHLRTHTQERPYVCCTCGRQFGHLSHLRRHELVHRRLEQDRPEARRTYQPRRIAPRPPPPAADIVRRSLESARLPRKVEPGAAPPGRRLVAAMAPVAAVGTVTPMVAVADGTVVLPAVAERDDVLTTVVGPECKEIIIVECEV